MRYAVLIAFAVASVSSSASAATLSPADTAAAFKAAGFKLVGKQWKSCDDPGTPSYSPGAISEVRDMNGDGLHEVVITEGSAFCYGDVPAYALVSKQPSGGWKLMTSGRGILGVLPTKGVGGWLDLEIGGPGFCFPVHRWDGKQYRLHRHAYEGKACRPN